MSHTLETLISSLDNSFLVFLVLLLCQLLYTLVMVDAAGEADGPEQWSSELLWMCLCMSILFSPTVMINLVFLRSSTEHLPLLLKLLQYLFLATGSSTLDYVSITAYVEIYYSEIPWRLSFYIYSLSFQ